MSFVTRLFPLLAILSAVTAYWFPAPFAGLSSAIVPLLTVIMFAMGLTLTLDSFKRVLQAPFKVLVGTVLQFLLMPLAAFVIAFAFSLQAELMTGLILVGSCPGGTASNVVCYLAKGDLALSIALTMVSTLLSVFATPLLTWVYLGQAVDVPIGSMMLSILQIVIVPVVAGLLLNTWFGPRLNKFTPLFPAVSVIAIVLIIGIVVALNRDNFALVGLTVVAAVILHNGCGIAGAYWISKLFKFDERTCRTLAIEVGMQNSGLGVALATQFYSAVAALPGAVFSLWHNLSGSMLAGYWGQRNGEQHERS